jgi:hypothetical protein
LNAVQQELLRALIAAQVAVLEWGEESVKIEESLSIRALEECLKVATKFTKKLRTQ